MTWFERVSPMRIVALAVPLAGICVGGVVIRTNHQVHWMLFYAVPIATVGIAANLAFQYVALRLLQRTFRHRGINLLEGSDPKSVLALLACGTAASAVLVLAAIRLQPGLATVAMAVFPGLSLVGAMAAAALLAPVLRLPARRALVLVFASQFGLTLALRLL